jgi:chromate reductase, NAD(P)H dehydrogenase (quinone)
MTTTLSTGTPLRVLGISGSLRRDSHNTRLLRAAAAMLPPGSELEIWDGLKTIPPYDEDDEAAGRPAAVADLDAAVRAADAVLFATPEYNHSLPGTLKNALDWLSRPRERNPLWEKPVAVVGASTGLFGAVWAQAELRKVLGALNAEVLDAELPVGLADSAFTEDGDFADPELADRCSTLLAGLAATAPALAAAA